MKSKIIKKALLILIIVTLMISIPLYSKAFSFDTLLTDADTFIEQGSSSEASGISQYQVKPIADSIANILLVIAIGVAMISAAVMAINFIIQSVEDKAKIKEAMVPWIIGIFVTAGAYGIWRITMSVFYGLL